MFRLLAAVVAAAVVVLPARTAPAAKPESGTPLGPITAEQLDTTSNNLKQIGLAFHNYESAFQVFPTNIRSADQKPLLSWRVQILPFIEQDQLYKQFKLDEPWDSEHNKKLIEQMPEMYAPVRGKADKGKTFYQGIGGKHGWMKAKATVASFTDGLSNTFLCVEAAKPVIWTKPDDLEFDGDKVPALGGMFEGKFHAVMGDGSVNRFRKGIEVETLKRLICPNDGQVLPEDIGIDADEKK